MTTKSTPCDSGGESNPPTQLSALDWRVWFLGYGLGGCSGLCACVGLWSILIDDSPVFGSIALLISMAHGGLLTLTWLKRSTVHAGIATTICFLVGAIGILSVAWLMKASGSRVPALGSLYSLALMSAIMAFAVPLLMHQGSGRVES
ncbi:MAG: hypothetical protein MUF23_01005 [Pirellula sp.]|nr:hypothetical protein [Pirellula sp.]